MSLNFHVVKRPDMSKDAEKGDQLYYGQIRSLKKVSFQKLCDMIAMRSTAFIGDVMLVVEGLLSVMQERLEEGDIIQMGRLGNFRMVAGSKGAATVDDFDTSLFKNGRIVYVPGTMLNDIRKSATYEEIKPLSSEKSSPSTPDDDRPVIE
ncbi:HU family DNA-binding protein [uncultured Parabacteroides sp.]|jgi:predicted histone-like DNA-binding protein|uniref:HU family DNA-binding protein n=1 Tax=uncultured Parabacteroides sp. TaxID=512312 RepID=UPI0025D2C78C|nr:HU family DNA-binding protein [uncultured Parabacteroides sp.]